MVHDLRPHDGRWFKRLAWPPYTRALARTADGSLTLSEGTRAAVAAAYPALAKKPMEHIWHPAYRGETVTPEARVAARVHLGWGDAERVYGYCGQIRPYKGVEDLIAAFTGLADPAARLLIAGRPRDEGLAAALEDLAKGDSRIRLRLEDLTPEGFRACLGACDVVVAPFRHYLHSGSIVHALSAARPVLTPATPFATSLAAEIGRPDWLQTYDGPLAAAQSPATPRALALGAGPGGAAAPSLCRGALRAPWGRPIHGDRTARGGEMILGRSSIQTPERNPSRRRMDAPPAAGGES